MADGDNEAPDTDDLGSFLHTLQHTATHTATHCNTVEASDTDNLGPSLPVVLSAAATHCSRLQHTATHTATHCNTLENPDTVNLDHMYNVQWAASDDVSVLFQNHDSDTEETASCNYFSVSQSPVFEPPSPACEDRTHSYTDCMNFGRVPSHEALESFYQGNDV